MLPFAATKDLDILQHVLSVVAFAAIVFQTLRPYKSCVAAAADFDLDFLALVALDHKFRTLKRICFEIVYIDCAIGIIFSHLGSVLPRKQVLLTVGRSHSRVKRAKFKSIEVSRYENWWIFLIFALSWEASVNSDSRLSKLAISVNFNLIGLVRRLWWCQTKANTFVW